MTVRTVNALGQGYQSTSVLCPLKTPSDTYIGSVAYQFLDLRETFAWDSLRHVEIGPDLQI